MLYTYIIAPKTDANQTIFDYFSGLYSEILNQKRTKEINLKSENDVFGENDFGEQVVIEKKGVVFFLMKVESETLKAEMIKDVENPELFKMSRSEKGKIDMSEIKKITERFWT